MIKTKVRGFEKISPAQYKEDFGSDLGYTEIKLPRRATKNSSGYDIYSPLDFSLSPNEEIKIPTGIKSYMLGDEELLMFPRSSVGFKFNVKFNNTIPKIDSDYYNNESNEGHIWIKFTNTGKKDWIVKEGDAIAQCSFYKYLIVDGDCPVNEDRVGGIGSTNSNK
jgi:dUTP pyrophosphatase